MDGMGLIKSAYSINRIIPMNPVSMPTAAPTGCRLRHRLTECSADCRSSTNNFLRNASCRDSCNVL